jgi:acid phosphatase
MNNRKTVFVLLVALATLPPAAVGANNYCDVPLSLPESPLTLDMTLSQLQVVTRHGDRVPQAKISTDPIEWFCEPFASTLHSIDISPQSRFLRENAPVFVNEVFDSNPFFLPPNCIQNQLTAVGRDQHLALGSAMREKYVDRLGFLPKTLSSATLDQFFVRSTDLPRTKQSAQSFLIGLYPWPDRHGDPTVTMFTRSAATERMTPNTDSCPRLASLLGKDGPFLASPAVIQVVTNPVIADVGGKIGTPGDPVATITTSDNLFSRACHSFPLPTGVTLDDVTQMRDLTNQAAGLQSTFDAPSHEAARLAIGVFLGDIRDRIRAGATLGSSAPRMALLSGHDTTIWPLLATLGQDNQVLVPFASHIAFELWQDSQQDYWVAVEFNGTYLTVGSCTSPLCALADFEAAIADFVVTPAQYQQECMTTTPAALDATRMFSELR